MNGEGTPQTMSSGGVTLTEGPFAGWTTWSGGSDPYETLIGPFYFRADADGRARCVFEPQQRHLNGGGSIHGGCLMSFADFSLFAIAHNALRDAHAVTLTFHSEFIGAGALENWVEARGEIVRDARSVIFVRGIVTQAERPLLSFSGTLKKIARRE
jgi:acyl-coenzyme A thioesterase PaaI-like protein